MYKLIISAFFILLFTTVNNTKAMILLDSNKTESNEIFDEEDDFEFDSLFTIQSNGSGKIKKMKNLFHKRTSISFMTLEPSYSQGEAQYTEFNPNGKTQFNKVKSMGIMLGTTSYVSYLKDTNSILRQFKRSILEFRTYAGINDIIDSNKINSDAYKLNLGSSTGYAYKLDDSYLSLYTTDIFSWAFLDAKSGDSIVANTFKKNLRFGKMNEYGFNYQHSSGIGISAGYRQEFVYPRHLFWYDMGSRVTEEITKSLVMMATKRIKKNGNLAYPVIHFLIDAGVKTLFNHFRKNDMAFPFKSASPLIYNSVVLKLSYNIKE